MMLQNAWPLIKKSRYTCGEWPKIQIDVISLKIDLFKIDLLRNTHFNLLQIFSAKDLADPISSVLDSAANIIVYTSFS